MKEFVFTVPYKETVIGWTTFVVEADSLDEATNKLNKEAYMYHVDSEQDTSDDYEEFWDELSLERVEEKDK